MLRENKETQKCKNISARFQRPTGDEEKMRFRGQRARTLQRQRETENVDPSVSEFDEVAVPLFKSLGVPILASTLISIMGYLETG